MGEVFTKGMADRWNESLEILRIMGMKESEGEEDGEEESRRRGGGGGEEAP